MIRDERPGDHAAVSALLLASYPSPVEARLVEAMRASESLRLSLVAEEAGAVVGHVGFSPVLVAGSTKGMGLAPLTVAESRRRTGIGADLVRTGLDHCRALGAAFVVVLGDPTYYARFGFRPAAGWGLSDEYDGGFAFQALELVPGSIPPGAGLVRYAPEFSMFAE